MKSRLQAGSASAQRYKSALDGILTIIREEGVEGLYKGVASKLMQSVLTAAILFAGQRRIYEVVKKVCWFERNGCVVVLHDRRLSIPLFDISINRITDILAYVSTGCNDCGNRIKMPTNR